MPECFSHVQFLTASECTRKTCLSATTNVCIVVMLETVDYLSSVWSQENISMAAVSSFG